MVDLSENLWPTSNFKIPKYSGVMPNTREFDYSFFGVSSIMLQFADPKANMLLERSFEAIMDAGINPKSLNGSNIGVFVGGSLAEVYQDEKHIERKPVIG
jgi:fatty acid synthase